MSKRDTTDGTRSRASTIVGNPAHPSSRFDASGPSRSSGLSTTPRTISNPVNSAATSALNTTLNGTNGSFGTRRPQLSPTKTSHHARISSWSNIPPPIVTSVTTTAVPTRSSLDGTADALFPRDRVNLHCYTYKPSASHPGPASQPSPLPSSSTPPSTAPVSTIQFAHGALPWKVRVGDYVEIRRIPQAPAVGSRTLRNKVMSSGPNESKTGGEALKGLGKKSERDGFVFRVGEDCPNVPLNQVQVPDTVAAAFRFVNRLEVELIRLFDQDAANIDYVELRFNQYMGRADMWRLAMSLEGTTLHVGERLTLAGGAVRAEVYGIWRNSHRFASGILTAKTKTIYRSRSAQVYIFIQLCQETWEFDEDGERYYEKIVHGFLPDLFARWGEKGTSHLVTIICLARIHYDAEEVEYMQKHDLTAGLSKDYSGRWCKDFFRVLIDFERRSDWNLALSEIKKRLERMESEILMQYHLDQLEKRPKQADEKKRILGKWSFAYEGNVLEAINLALNPFDEHYIDRDLSRTGLSMTIVSPGTGHFAVDKNLLRLTTERMTDHGIGLDLVCMTKMPLHSVPLFSYVSQRPNKPVWEVANSGIKTKPATPDLLYFDAHHSSATDLELADCYSIPRWVNASYYSKTHDKPFRKDRFVPRCKMYEIQMLGILDHNLTTVTVPLLDIQDVHDSEGVLLESDERKLVRDDFDSAIFGYEAKAGIALTEATPVRSREDSIGAGKASYQSARLLAVKSQDSKYSPSSSTNSAQRLSSTTTSRLDSQSSPSQRPSSLSPGSIQSRGLNMPGQPTNTLELQRTDVRGASPAPSSLSIRINASTATANGLNVLNGLNGLSRSRSSTLQTSGTLSSTVSPVKQVDTASNAPSSGASTPKTTPRRLKNQPSRSSFASRFGGNWLLSALGGRSQPSFPTAAAETVSRQDVSSVTGTRSPSPSVVKSPNSFPRAVPGAPIVTPSTPSPSRMQHNTTQAAATKSALPTQPVPIASSKRRRMVSEDEPVKSLVTSIKLGKSPGATGSGAGNDSSWSKAAASNFNKNKSHVTVNPCNPKENDDTSFGEGRRWQHIKPKPLKESKHLVKWTSLTAPAIFPLTTDLMPTTREIADFYEVNSYDIACYPDQVSFLVRNDAAMVNLPLAVMREMASQRLSQNFQFITLPHDHDPYDEDPRKATTKVLLPGDSTKDGLRVGGASEVLRNANGAIYLLWSNNIHRLAFDSTKQSVTVQRFVKKLTYDTDPVKYTCLVWPSSMSTYHEATSVFRYPNIEVKLNFNYLDRLIAGEEEELSSSLRYWRTRYILIPSGRDPLSVQGVVPTGEHFDTSEVLITGAIKVLEVLSRNQWYKPGQTHNKPLRLLPTTFDPSACVLDDGLMNELERLNHGEEQIDGGKTLKGMTLQNVAEMMRQPNNGLVIRDRWWNFNVHEDSFTGEQFCEWLMNTFMDVKTVDEAAEWGRSLFDKGLIEHVMSAHGFFNYGHFFYRLRKEYDNRSQKSKPAKSWFGGTKPTQHPRDLIERHAELSTSPLNASDTPLSKLSEQNVTKTAVRKRKIKMTQSVIIDLDPGKKSDRAEVAVLHSDIIHNARNAFHFELNWIGVTAGLLDELRQKCSAQAERYGLRFVEAPVEQIKDISLKCAYRAPVPIPLALAPPIVPDLHLRLKRLSEQKNSGTVVTGQTSNYYEHAILTKFGFVLDVEATNRYPDTIEVEYTYRGTGPGGKFEYSQFCHKSGLALVQCIGAKDGFLWCDNRLFIAAPTRGRVGGGSGMQESYYPNAPVPIKLTKSEEAKVLREELQRFCSDAKALQEFYDSVTPPSLEHEEVVKVDEMEGAVKETKEEVVEKIVEE